MAISLFPSTPDGRAPVKVNVLDRYHRPVLHVNAMERPVPPPDDAPALLFFAFRALTAEPDRILAERGLGRVHHRVLYFVARDPGVRVGALVAALGVTKQALHGPLRELLRARLVAASVPPGNRRAKELRLTPEGARLERRLTGAQRKRFERAFEAAGADA